MITNFCSVSKNKTAFLSFIISELFILIIELTFGIPLNVYYYLDLNLTKPTDTLSFLIISGEQTQSAGNSILVTNLLSMLLWFFTSPAILIAVVVYLLAPDDESKRGPD